MDKRYIDSVKLLLDVMPFVFSQRGFALKGGSAINLFLMDMPRLSVDVDVVYTSLEHDDRESALKSIEKTLDKVADQLANKLGVAVTRPASGGEYESRLFIRKGRINIKVEVNHVFRGTVYPVKEGILSPFVEKEFSRTISVPMLDPDELYAGKIVAALDRQHPRDLFDVKLLYETSDITPRIRRCVVIYLAGHNRPIHELLPPNKKEIDRAFRNEFAGMTRNEIQIEELENVRERLFLEFPASFDDKERAFLVSIKRRKPDWEILGLPGIERLPALQWKLLNINNLANRNPAKYRKMLKFLETKLLTM